MPGIAGTKRRCMELPVGDSLVAFWHAVVILGCVDRKHLNVGGGVRVHVLGSAEFDYIHHDAQGLDDLVWLTALYSYSQAEVLRSCRLGGEADGPDGHPRKVKIQDTGDGIYKATYIPDDCGRYKVYVKYGGKDVPQSPFQVQAVATGSADKCKITEGIQRTLVNGEEYCITVNTKNAGYGAVTCRIRSTSG
ncbi:hypothetical protein PR048_011643, partial [Dryococelus australis]